MWNELLGNKEASLDRYSLVFSAEVIDGSYGI
jgi:hypothetical protein